jgi:hypothetical protein
MTYHVADRLNTAFKLDENFNLVLGGHQLADPMCKGYVYANLFFYDETQKEIVKLRQLVEKIYNEVIMELGLDPNDPAKLLLEVSTRVTHTIGDDGLDILVKEFLSQKSNHLSLMIDAGEKQKFETICEAIFMELTESFYKNTLEGATDAADDFKTFKFSQSYVDALNARQKSLIVPALRVIALINKKRLNNLRVSDKWAVMFMPESTESGFTQQEEQIKEQLKEFLHASE